ncbi:MULTISPECIES: DUF2269 domain-containing protein [Methylobacterium]|uniref:DUF2269 domain-containing protein n=1 Tax=Methylobacterium bullatum TaxID=570505 RepID=A0AAV4Z420_9HYPH|nr:MULTISPECIES: DUF2269 domain-containing protein [Methylobacterium]MBD8901613.1 hypothetical protein [Methylobacterium bullatum]TXN33759.1 DUF2269 domain-containing protein [Methylobacterium sp. WL19]GJD38259.1 hypothetical protein OICFNHDK_0703 [Methylobacterium bullatum]
MEYVDLLRWLHVIGATILLGTGAGIAFFMTMAHRTGRPDLIAHVAGTVVVADTLFTATAAVIQPVTGWLLARAVGWPLSEGWIALSLILYVVIGLFWLPVVRIQTTLRDLAGAAAASGMPLPPRYHRLYRIWFACGFPAFAAILAIVWLMTAKPRFALF